ncbi:molybdate ABC transporter substrate-binding protein [Polynucleobacter sp. AP-Nino-20-G2]|nr:molybdate ABC transporter substrate-binding protein [Polynucleobacter sp. AP-Nino-20-G2]
MYVSIAVGQTTSVAVASNMKDAFTEIYTAFKVNRKSDVRVVYGSSGNFATQILNGAPFNIFIAADEQFPLELYRQGKTMDSGKVYALGKLALIAGKASDIKLTNDKAELARVIAKANKIAIAKPELAPYGKAAIEYLKAEGLWDQAKAKLVYGDNVGAATMFVATGAADVGFTALSLAQSPQIAKETRYLQVSEGLYEPIKQRMVVIKDAPQEAIDLYQFMQSPKARDILLKHGYSLPK